MPTLIISDKHKKFEDKLPYFQIKLGGVDQERSFSKINSMMKRRRRKSSVPPLSKFTQEEVQVLAELSKLQSKIDQAPTVAAPAAAAPPPVALSERNRGKQPVARNGSGVWP